MDFNKMNKYLENRLSLDESNKVIQQVNSSPECKKEFDELSNVFNLLNNYAIIDAPHNLADNVMLMLKSKNKINNIFILKTIARSMVAAGLVITILNFIPAEYMSFDFIQLNLITDFNHYIFEPLTRLTNLILK